MADQKLMDYFDFDVDDLRANQKGHLTDKQRRRLGYFGSRRKWGLIAVASLFMVFAGPLLLLLFGPLLAEPSGAPRNVGWLFLVPSEVVIGLCLVCPAVCVALMIFASIRAAYLKLRREVARTAGTAEYKSIQERECGKEQSVVLCIGKQEFDVKPDLKDIVAPGRGHVVYYLRATRDILSVEAPDKAAQP